MSAKVEPLLTVADLDAMPDDGNRYELFDGEIFVSRAPGLTHQIILANLLTILRTYLDRNAVGQVIPTPGVIFGESDAAIPDLVVISDRLFHELVFDERINGAPELMVEIVSPGKENARRDRVVKRQVYGKFGVKEYWIVDPEKRAIEVYRLKKRALMPAGTKVDEDDISTPLLPGLVFKAGDVFKT
ncbi:MAG TPA: Uma2 family endonuclease [Pyrinomonadaceae bacterium]|nr:Uma2 family endonuclease [Pyrinomonadaceae bacterium]